MLRHNLILAFRNFKRYKSSFFINLIGLSSGLACVLLIYLWVSDELGIDKFHKNDQQLFQVIEHYQHTENTTSTTFHTAGLLAETLVEEMPEVIFGVATDHSQSEQYTLSVDDRNHKAIGTYVGLDFFNVFSYPLIEGDKDMALVDKTSIVISEELALRMFNTTEDIIGKVVDFQHETSYQISGVFRIKPNSSTQFDFALSFEAYKELHNELENWLYNAVRTYVVLKEGTDLDQFNKKISGFMATKGEFEHRTLALMPYGDAYLYGRYENGKQAGGRIQYVHLFSMIAIFILLIGCINFMNLSTARSSRRIKEIGIKKAVGAGRSKLIFQYLGESLLMTVISLITAIIAVLLLGPQFSEITGKHLILQPQLGLILAFLGIAFITGVISGSYPALYLSGFNPVIVLKGKLQNSTGELWTRRGLVIFQFSLSVILIVSVLVIYYQIDFVQSKNLGYDKDNILHFEIEGELESKLETFLSEAKNLPGVVDASSIGESLVGGVNTIVGLKWKGSDPENKIVFEIREVNYGMIEMLDIEFKKGRNFSGDYAIDADKIIFNEAAVAVMGLVDPIGQIVDIYGTNLEIVGVVRDFHFKSLHEKVAPLFFVCRPENTSIAMVKVESRELKGALVGLEGLHGQFNPGFAFDFRFLDDDYQTLYTAEQQVSVLSRYFAGLAILISCLGLFGLAAFTAERRLKEIGIRKILGSTNYGIISLLSSDFTKMVGVAILIALPLSYLIAAKWLDNFAFSIDLELWFFLSAGILTLLIAWLTVGLQTVKAAQVNPIQCLRDE